jgi:predicted GNAT family N-acyltransferase
MGLDEVIIRQARTEEVIDLRHAILRTGLPRELAYFDGDEEATTHHVVAELDRKVVGCATVLQRPWNGVPAWQVRGMAVAPEIRGGGIGAMLLHELERIVERDANHSLQLWCNARVPARRFYEQHGWVVASDEFEIQHAGPHVKMVKRLTRGAPVA